MVQVDIFWSYGIGASFAVAASRQIKKQKEKTAQKADESAGPFLNPYFLTAVLYLSVLFAPSGAYLLWDFTSWETMHVMDKSMPAWLVAAFSMTNTTQGILGFYAAYALIQRGKTYQAYLHWLGAYFLMFFILVHGWDGTGYQRFFSETKQDFINWKLENIRHWLTCPAALALYGMGVFIVPGILVPASRWLHEEAPQPVARWKLAVRFLGCIGVSLGVAVGASLLIHTLGWMAGTILFGGLIYFMGIRHGGVLHFFYCRLLLPEQD